MKIANLSPNRLSRQAEDSFQGIEYGTTTPTCKEFTQEAANPNTVQRAFQELEKGGWSILPVPLVALLLKMKNLLIKNDMRLPKVS